MSAIKIKASVTGALVRTYTNNPEYGYVVLETEDLVFGSGWIRETTRTCLLRSQTKVLNKFVGMSNIPGRIQLLEFLEDSIPANIQKDNLREDVAYEEAISTFIKRAGADGPALTIGGKRIVKFTNYDPSGQSLDIVLSHDNVTEVAQFRASSADANLPGGPDKTPLV